jgi:hypothetical protein
MNPTDQQSNTPPQPVAYDAEGRPLYLHPPHMPQFQEAAQPQIAEPAREDVAVDQLPFGQRSSHVTARPESAEGHNFDPQLRSQYANEPSVVHAGREIEPQQLVISDELRKKHERSVQRYPFLNLSEGEYVILDIKRHPIGMIIPILFTGLTMLVLLGFAALYPSIMNYAFILMPDPSSMLMIVLLLCLIVALGGAIILWVYLQNQFLMTNESVIQEIQESLFSRHEQTVSLGSIEDASFRKSGILQTIFDYGTIRLSTEGEETTYVFHYVHHPKRQIAILNNAIEAFKNGRPVSD